MTNGTVGFLLKLAEKHDNLGMKLMHNNEGGLAYYEHNRKKVFQAGRGYEIVETIGKIQDAGYVVMNHIPVDEENQPTFEERIGRSQHLVEVMPGFLAFRFLKPLKGNMYIVLTQWRTKKDFNRWKGLDEFHETHQPATVKSSTYLFESPHIAYFKMYTEEEDE